MVVSSLYSAISYKYNTHTSTQLTAFVRLMIFLIGIGVAENYQYNSKLFEILNFD